MVLELKHSLSHSKMTDRDTIFQFKQEERDVYERLVKLENGVLRLLDRLELVEDENYELKQRVYELEQENLVETASTLTEEEEQEVVEEAVEEVGKKEEVEKIEEVEKEEEVEKIEEVKEPKEPEKVEEVEKEEEEVEKEPDQQQRSTFQLRKCVTKLPKSTPRSRTRMRSMLINSK